MSAADTLEVGDLVFVGPPAPLTRKVVWRILKTHQAADGIHYATLSSGMTERLRVAPVSTLTRFRVMENA